MWKHLVEIQNSQLSIDRMCPLIDWNHEEDFNKQFGWLNQFLIPVRSIKKANSIDRKEFSMRQNFNKFSTNSRVDPIDSRFLFNRSKRNIRSIEGNSRLVKTCETEFSKIFTKQFSMVFMNKLPSYKHNRLSLRSKLNTIDAIALKFNLTY